jgi:hypothetical protein
VTSFIPLSLCSFFYRGLSTILDPEIEDKRSPIVEGKKNIDQINTYKLIYFNVLNILGQDL